MTELLSDPRFYAALLEFDRDLAISTRSSGCNACGGVLHGASYPRKPRGGPEGLGGEFDTRFSFCCAAGGCRRRATPPSVRFLGRKVYLGAVVVLITAMLHGPTPARLARLAALIGASPRTIARWRAWWQTTFAEMPFWKAAAGRFATPIDIESLPLSILERFVGDDQQRLAAVLRFLSPITTSSAGASMAF